MRVNRILTTVLIVCAGFAMAQSSEAYFDGSSAEGWDSRRDAARLARDFHHASFAPTNDGAAALYWAFAPRATSFNDLSRLRPVERKFSRVKISLENRGAAFQFAVKALDESMAEWTIPPIPLEAQSGPRTVEIPVSNFRVASWSRDPDGALDFPLANLVLIAFGLKNGDSYAVAIRSITLEYDALPRLALKEIACPATGVAGAPFEARFDAVLERGAFQGEQAFLELKAAGIPNLRLPLKADQSLGAWKVGESRALSTGASRLGAFDRGGIYSVGMKIDGYGVELRSHGREVAPMVKVEGRTPGRVLAELKPHRGVPTLFLDGRPRPFLAFSAYYPATEVFTDFERIGVDLFCVMATPTDHAMGLARTSWKSEGEFDFTQLDERIGMVLAGNSNAYVIPRLYLAAPRWWSTLHPDELVTYDPGDGKPVPFLADGKPVPSWASEAWRADTARALRRYIAYVEASPFADRVIGYHLASGTTEEWMQWAANARLHVDFSPANTRRFRAWLAALYKNDAALKAAWRNPAVNLATASVPGKSDRLTCRLGTLRDPESEQPSVDYALYTSDLVAETIGYFCSVVKEATKRTKLTGAFYGYVLQLMGDRQQGAGHLALRKVWDCPDLDFIACPTSYATRALSNGTTHMMSLLDGAMRAGKLWIDENDIRTSISPGKPWEWGKPADVAGDVLQQERELALVLTRGFGQWWFDCAGNRYGEPRILAAVSNLTRLGRELLSADRTPVDEVAFVVDSRALALMEMGNALSPSLIMKQIPQAHRMGAPIGWYEISDLETLPARKMYVFLNLWNPTAKDLAQIAKLKAAGRVLVFLYGAGAYENGKFSPKASQRLLGFPLEFRTNAMPMGVTVAQGALGNAEAFTYADGLTNRGVFIPASTAGKILGRLPGGEAGLVMVENATHTTVWSAGPALPARLLRALALKAGVHLWIDTEDVVWAAKETLAVTVDAAGVRKVRLPRAARVTELYTGARMGEHMDSFDLAFPQGGTRLFRLE